MARWPGRSLGGADEDGAGADFAGGVEVLGAVVEDEGAGGVDAGEGEGALVVDARRASWH